MSHIKKFSYRETSGRWLILLVLFITFFNTTVLLSDATVSFREYFPYVHVFKTVLMIVIASIFTGNILGRLIYASIKKYRLLNILIAVLFSASALFYAGKSLIPETDWSNISIYIMNQYYVLILIAVPSLLCGILNSYFLKVCCGDFIDEKNLLIQYILVLLISLSAGIGFIYLLNFLHMDGSLLSLAPSLLTVAVPFLLYFIRIPFTPELMYAQHLIDEEKNDSLDQNDRDDLFFTYMNFSYILLYLTLGYLVVNKFFGTLHYHLILYIMVSVFFIIAGMLAGRMRKHLFWHVYSEMLYPVCFIFYLFMLYHNSDIITAGWGIALAGIPAFVFGFSLKQTIVNITTKYDHEKRFNIIDFSLFIMPVPLISAISFVHFTNITFFLLLYTIAGMNILIPGIFMLNVNIDPLKKILYLMFSLIFIPAIIFMHLYFEIPLSGKSFYSEISNYEILRNTNYNIPYITGKGTVTLSGAPVFYLSDSTIRNMKRAAGATAVFNAENSSALILDSNQKFFRNTAFSFYNNPKIIDTLPEEKIDYNRLPFSGRQLYVSENQPLYKFLSQNKKAYDFIIDSPNIMDQLYHESHFSSKYYSLIKKNMNSSGVYALIINLQFHNGMLAEAAVNLKASFEHHVVFLFSNIAVVMASDDKNSLMIDKNSISRMEKIIMDSKKFGILFYSPIHPLNNIIFKDIDNLRPFLKKSGYMRPPFYGRHEISNIPEPLAEYYLSYEPEWFSSLLKNDKENHSFANKIKSQILKEQSVLKLLKKTEYSESINNYENETDYLFQLRKLRSYNSSLKEYIDTILAYKEKYYYDEAVRLEKEKKWDHAATLYKAILNINKNNFDANYRFGLLYITIQDLNNAFKYLNTALKLNKNHPNVLYQMGVLMFSSDKPDEAIDFFEKARQQKEKHASLFMYLGLAYEKTGKLDKAREFFGKAIIEDPNDKKLQSLLDETNEKLKSENGKWQQEKRTNMIEDEKDEEIILPVNKKALKSRLMDEE